MANFAEIRLFGRALSKENSSVSHELIVECAKKGYAIDRYVDQDRVKAYIDTLPINYNSTFYSTFEEVVNLTTEEVAVDQILHYISTYGTNFQGKAYVPNQSDICVDFTDCKFINSITIDEITVKVKEMLYSNIALHKNTLKDLFELIDEFDITLSLFKIQNREAIIAYKVKYGIYPKDVDDMMSMINYMITGSAMIVKSRENINMYHDTFFHSNRVMNDEVIKTKELIEYLGYTEVSKGFNRYKRFFLSMKESNKEFAPIINKISKLSKKHHVPCELPWSTKFLTKSFLNGNYMSNVSNLLKEASIFQLSKYYNAVQKRLLPYRFYDTYNVRNGKSFVKVNNFDLTTEEIDVLLNYKSMISSELRAKCNDKFKNTNFKVMSDINMAIPTSEKNFTGTLPINSRLKITNDSAFIVGIHWFGKDGAVDLDLSFLNLDGQKIGWNASYNDESIVYSGDMTSANPEATECLWFTDGLKDGVFAINGYQSKIDAKFTFFVAKVSKDISNYGRGYMVNPDDIIFKTQLSLSSLQMTAAIFTDGQFIFTNRGLGNSRVSNADFLKGYIDSQIKLSNCSPMLNDYLYTENSEVYMDYETNIPKDCFDLTTDDKSALISLLS